MYLQQTLVSKNMFLEVPLKDIFKPMATKFMMA